MKFFGIRARILLAALTPALLVTLLVTAILTAEHSRQTQIEQQRRIGAVARHLGMAAEYHFFVGNDQAFGRLIESALSEPDVVAAIFQDGRGTVVATSLSFSDMLPPAPETFDHRGIGTLTERDEYWYRHTIRATTLGEFDLFDGGAAGAPPPLVGHVLLKISNRALTDEIRRYAYQASAIAAAVMALGLLLALALARPLIRTLGQIADVVEAIRKGRHDRRVRDFEIDELGRLAQGINDMADTVGQTQAALTARVSDATASLRRERDEAAAAALSRSRFFAAASHDLRQPVQALGLFVARLSLDARQSLFLPRIEQIARSAHNLQGLLDTLLDYSRLSGQVYQVVKKPVNTGILLLRILNEFTPAAAEKRIALRQRGPECWIQTDETMLYRILINLVSNAIRYTESGTVLLACRRGASHARLEVWDTGCGIPPDAHETVFEELVQLENPERDATKGLGLGLAIVRRTAALLEHPLALCSQVGRGSRFSIIVPLAASAHAVAETPARGGSDPLAGMRLLVAARPDMPSGLPIEALENWGCAVTVVTQPEMRDWIGLPAAPDVVLWESDENELAATLARLDQLEEVTGHALPALIVTPEPGPAPHDSLRGATRLRLSRPFRLARLRALVARLGGPQDTPPDDQGR